MPLKQERGVLARQIYFRKLEDATRVQKGKTYNKMVLSIILQVQLM